MSDTPVRPPRIRVALPGASDSPGDLPGRLLRWQQDETGVWWAEVLVRVPAGAVAQVQGEDYAAVPREAATPPAPGYVLVTSTPDGGKRSAEVHLSTCWLLPDVAPHQRVTPLPDEAAARDMLGFDDTTACGTCHPKPTQA